MRTFLDGTQDQGRSKRVDYKNSESTANEAEQTKGYASDQACQVYETPKAKPIQDDACLLTQCPKGLNKLYLHRGHDLLSYFSFCLLVIQRFERDEQLARLFVESPFSLDSAFFFFSRRAKSGAVLCLD